MSESTSIQGRYAESINNRARAEAHTTYRIVVYEDEPHGGEYEADAFVDGCIDLMPEAKRVLEARLDALELAGAIGEWFIERYEPPSLFTEAGVLNFIAGVGEDRDEEIVAVWDGIE